MAEEEIQEEGGKKGGMGKMLMFGGVGVLLVVVGIFVGPMVLNSDEPAEGAEGEEAVVEVSNKPPIYQTLHPPMVINFKDEVGDAHFMQITMEVMSRDQEVINLVRDHTPAIRNSLILLYGQSIYEEVVTREGKEKMLEDGLAEIQRVILETTGETGVEALYFTALVVQ